MAPSERRAVTGNMASVSTPVLSIEDWLQPFSQTVIVRLGEILREYVVTQRWYRAKARTIEQLQVRDIMGSVTAGFLVLLLQIDCHGSERDHYLLPLAISRDSDDVPLQDVIANLRSPDGKTGVLFNALSDRFFRDALLDTLACGGLFRGRDGDLVAHPSAILKESCEEGLPSLDSFISQAEQSNTSIIYAHQYILKLFRKIEPGINPDIEIGSFLLARGFRYTPAVFGSLEYVTHKDGEIHGAAILQQFVPNHGDAWKYTLGALAGFFARALNAGGNMPSALPAQHPLDLMTHEPSLKEQGLLGDYVFSAELLGVRTAEMHTALADPDGGPHFAPEPFTQTDGEQLYQNLLTQTRFVSSLIRAKESSNAINGDNVRQLVESEQQIARRFDPLRDPAFVSAMRIRHHGDYHLGQVLYTGADFMIIDFEGEPARPLPERRAKALGLRDVAGMLRSFHYAASAALYGQVAGIPTDPKMAPRVEALASFWNSWIGAIYLKAYFRTASPSCYVPAGSRERRLLLDAFLLQKALYELAYELNNRPDWVRIPLRGVLSLLA